ncbi:MAG: hypothetical protein QOI10_1611 [Solirubrobacterales bacterium]|nr:hypothetical protein [Solirubrobacterales bacterium]
MRRGATFLWLALATSFTALVLCAPALAKTADITDADVSLRLAPDGSLLVTENLKFNYDGHFEGSYRDIVLRHGERITDVTLSQDGRNFRPGGNTTLGSHDTAGLFGTERFGGTFRIVWHYSAADEQRTTTISYRVVDGVVAYDDVLDIGWAVWGDQWDFDLDHLTADFTNPALDPADPLYRVWGHSDQAEGTTTRGDGVASLSADDVEQGHAVEFRVTMPRDPAQDYPAARHVDADGLPKILADEQAIADDINAPWNQFKLYVSHHAFLVSLGIAAVAWLLSLLLILLARERRTDVPEYLPEPPDDATPALAYGIAHEGEDSTNTVLATLLDLVDRGYYETSEATTDDEKLDLSLKQKADRPAGELTDYEQDVLAFFDQLLDGRQVAMSAMKDEIPEHSELWRGRWERMTEKLNAAEDGALVWDRNLNWARWLVAGGATGLFGFVIILALAETESWVPAGIVALLTVVGILSLSATRFKRLDADHVERTARWKAFEHWTEDFPRLSDDPPATLALWKRIIVFGVAFGTAERMIKSGRIPAPVVADASSSGAWSAYAFTGGFNSASFSGSSFSSGFSSQVAPQSSSSGGGGGFSGGGGGGSW